MLLVVFLMMAILTGVRWNLSVSPIFLMMQKSSKYLQTNSTIHQKDYTSWSSCIHSRNAKVVQHMQIDKHNTANNQKQGQENIIISIDTEKAFD
jgi:hypothetical protein